MLSIHDIYAWLLKDEAYPLQKCITVQISHERQVVRKESEKSRRSEAVIAVR